MKMYKVRIKKAPDSMAYGGQSGFGLDLSQSGRYDEMTDNPYDSVSNTIQPVDREDANIEAEAGETAYGSFGKNGQKQHMKIGGKKHSQGGTPLNVPEGTFIYSDTKKLRIGGSVLSNFGKSPDTKQKYTPAQLAKQYDVNKYRAILDDPYADKLSKETAGMMVENFEKKLGGLALLQESMKGFPQGIPDIAMSVLPQGMAEQMAEMGGYYGNGGGYYADGGPTPEKVKKEDIAKYEAQGYKKVEGTNIWRLPGSSGRESKDIIITPGTAGSTTGGGPGSFTPGYNIPTGGRTNTGTCANLLYTIADMTARPGCYNTFLNKQGFKDATDDEKKKGLDELLRGRMPKYTPATAPTATPGTPETKTCPDGPNGEKNYYTPDPNDPTKCIRSFETPPKEITYDEIPVGKIPPGDTPGQTPQGGRRPFFGKQFMVPPKRYTPYVAPLNAMIPEPTFYDPNRELAEGASNRNMMAAYMQQMDPQQFSARANALNAQGAEQAANTIGKYQNMNVGVANQFSPLQTDIMNKVMGYRADAADKLVFNSQQEDKAYRNAMRMDLRNRDMYDINEYDRMTKLGMLNETNPYYSIEEGPRGGSLKWKDKNNWMNMVTGQSSQLSQNQITDMENYAQQLKDTRGMDSGTIQALLRARYPNFYQSGNRSSNAAAINAQYMDANRGSMAQSAYPFGYDDGYGY
jgi:hypothetical protein